MSSSWLESRGPVGNAVAGYRLAWLHRRPLTAVLLPVLATVSIGLVLLDFVLGRDHLVIIDYVPVVRDESGEVLAWARLLLFATCWLLALSAGALTVTGAACGHAVRPALALRAAVRHFPVFAVGMCAAAGGTALMLWVVAGLAGLTGSGPVGLVLILGTLVAAAVVSARMLVGVLSHQLGGSDWRLTRGRVTGTAGAFLLGGVVVPLLLALPAGALLEAVPPGAARPLGAVLLGGTVAVQAGILALVHLLQRDVPAQEGQESADLVAVGALVAELSGPARRSWLPAVVAVVAVLAPVGVAVVNPFGAPAAQSHEDTPSGAVAAAWPSGQHPVVVTRTGVRFCDNDVCDRYAARNGGPALLDGRGSAGISADGSTVVRAAVTGGPADGGPLIHYARCTRDGCTEAWLPVRASAEEPVGSPELAVAVAPDRALWFALAAPSADDRPGKATYRITLIRCADAGCTAAGRHQPGTVQRLPYGEAEQRQPARLSIGADGRPVATVRTGMGAVLVTCEPVTCARPTNTWAFAGAPGTQWVAPSTPDGQVVALEPGTLRIGEQLVSLRGNEVAPGSGALATGGSRSYATVAEATTRPGLHIQIGATGGQPDSGQRPGYWQQVLWHCDGPRCRRQVLDAFETMGEREILAAGADGRVLIIRPDRMLLVSAPAAG